MIKKLIPVILILTFGGAGVAAGLMLKPEDVSLQTEGNPCGDDPNGHSNMTSRGEETAKEPNAQRICRLSMSNSPISLSCR